MIEWVSQWATDEPVTVLDIGGRDVNGTSRSLFPNATYCVLDVRAGANVDIVADAATWTPDREYDLVLCTEVFEHTPDWRLICKTAFAACKPGGRFVVTCAGPGRHPHSAIEATGLQPGEHYENVSKADLSEALTAAGWCDVVVERLRLDTRGVAVKG